MTHGSYDDYLNGYCTTNVPVQYNLDNLIEIEDYFINVYKKNNKYYLIDMLKNEKSNLYKYLNLKSKELINIKQFYDQLYKINVDKYPELYKFYSINYSNEPKLDYDKNYYNYKVKFEELEFTKLEKFIISKLVKNNDIEEEKTAFLMKLYQENISERVFQIESRLNNKIIDLPDFVNNEDIVVLVDKENVSANNIKELISKNYQVYSFYSVDKSYKEIKNENLIKINNFGKNSADFAIILHAQNLLITSKKKIVVFTNDHFGRAIKNSNRYFTTSDINMISIYFNSQFEKSNLCNKKDSKSIFIHTPNSSFVPINNNDSVTSESIDTSDINLATHGVNNNEDKSIDTNDINFISEYSNE